MANESLPPLHLEVERLTYSLQLEKFNYLFSVLGRPLIHVKNKAVVHDVIEAHCHVQ